MTGLVDRAVRPSLPDGVAAAALRPVPPQRGLPRLMRGLVGVNEDVLDWVPEERPRHTRMGFIVFNTGVLAGVSMHLALSSVVGPHWWLVFADLLWSWIIITVDSWLVSSTHGAARTSLFGTYLPRLVLAVLLGAVIAEPLVLSVFHQSIGTEISEYRKTKIDDYRTTLERCNPPTGVPDPSPSCTGFLVTVGAGPQPIEDELARANASRDDLRQQAADIDSTLARLEQLAVDECAGSAGPGLSGRAGEGPECARNREKADEFRRDNQVGSVHEALSAADQRAGVLSRDLARAAAATEHAVSTAINTEVAKKSATLTEHGLLDEFEALSRLSAKHSTVLSAHVLLVLLLIALDCLPVLSRMLSGHTEYDARMRRQLDVSARLHDLQLRASERRDLELRERRSAHQLRADIDVIGGEDRSAKERHKIETAEQIDRLAAALEKHG